jgi:hypothetical protein
LPDLVKDLIVAAATIGFGAIALWTWQRRYWLYQMHHQTRDWKHRQTYTRKDSQRIAMETLLTDMNCALEEFIAAAILTASAKIRQGSIDEASAEDWNKTERHWLVHSRVLLGQLSLHFGDAAKDAGKQWLSIIEQSEQTCDLLNESDANPVWDLMDQLRERKRRLLSSLQTAIDNFVSSELTVAPDVRDS